MNLCLCRTVHHTISQLSENNKTTPISYIYQFICVQMQKPKRHFTMLTFRSIVHYIPHQIILTGKIIKKKTSIRIPQFRTQIKHVSSKIKVY